MSSRTHVLPLGFGLSAVLCLSTPASPEDPPPRPRPPARVYTNEDLDRVHPFSDETGVRSVPAVPPGRGVGAGSPTDRHETTRGHGEAYWRAQAERAREKVRRLDEQAQELRSRIARAEDQRFRGRIGGRTSSGRNGSGRTGSSFFEGDRVATMQARLATLERRAREVEEDLADRARKDGALPGWLR